jgi:hypothetical protein
MIVFLFIILFAGILGFIYLGVSLSESIKESENKFLFWLLYFVSALTIFLVIVCIFLFAKYRKKVGLIGPRGFMGEQGEQGDPGNCGDYTDNTDEFDCKHKTFMLMIQKTFREALQRELKSDENTLIYNFVFVEGNVASQTNPDGSQQNPRPLNFTNTKYTDLKKFNNKLLTEIEKKKQDKKNKAESQETIVSDVLIEMEKEIFSNSFSITGS